MPYKYITIDDIQYYKADLDLIAKGIKPTGPITRHTWRTRLSTKTRLLLNQWEREGYDIYTLITLCRRKHRKKERRTVGKELIDRQGNLVEFHLTLPEYIDLCVEPYNGKPTVLSIGESLSSLCLMRNDDLGSYSVGNCRFGTHSENNFARYSRFD